MPGPQLERKTTEGHRVAFGGDAGIAAKRDITIASAQDTDFHESQISKSGLLRSSSYHGVGGGLTNQAAAVQSGGDLTLTSGGSATILASKLGAADNLSITAGAGPDGNPNANVNILSEQDLFYLKEESRKSKINIGEVLRLGFTSGLDLPFRFGGVEYASREKLREGTLQATNAASLLLAGGDIQVKAAQDINVVGSHIQSGGTAALEAGRDVAIVAGKERQAQERSYQKTSIGVYNTADSGGLGGNAGLRKIEEGFSRQGDYNARSTLGAGEDVTVTAGRTINQISSDIVAQRDIGLTAGQDVNSLAAQDVETIEQYFKQVDVGLKASARQNVSAAVQSVAALPQAPGTGYTTGERAINTASAVVQAVSAASSAMSSAASASIAIGASGEVRKQSSTAHAAVPSQIHAGRDATLEAGDDIDLQGAQLSAGRDVALKAGDDLTIRAAEDSFAQNQSNKALSAEIGFGASVGAGGAGYGLYGAASASMGKADAEAATHRNATVTAGDALTIVTGDDAAIAGANLDAERVRMDVGGDLTVASLQDSAHSANRARGGSVSVGPGKGGGSAGVSAGQGSSDLAWVGDQTSVVGRSEVDIRVEGNTHLEGAVIAADNANLTLDTGSLTYADLHDSDEAEQFGLSVGAAWTGGGKGGAPSGDVSHLGVTYSARDAGQITRATIGEGAIVLRNDPEAGLDGLNRNLDRAQEIVRQTGSEVRVYIDVAAVETIGAALSDFFAQAKDSAPPVAQTTLAATEKLAAALRAAGLTEDQVRAELRDNRRLDGLLTKVGAAEALPGDLTPAQRDAAMAAIIDGFVPAYGPDGRLLRTADGSLRFSGTRIVVDILPPLPGVGGGIGIGYQSIASDHTWEGRTADVLLDAAAVTADLERRYGAAAGVMLEAVTLAAGGPVKWAAGKAAGVVAGEMLGDMLGDAGAWAMTQGADVIEAYYRDKYGAALERDRAEALAGGMAFAAAGVIGGAKAMTVASSLFTKGVIGLRDVWRLSPTERGTAIEVHLAQTEYKDWFNVGQLKNGKFPLVDFQNGNTLVSLKSVDTTGTTWLKRIEDHIDDLGSRGASVDGKTANMVLDLRVQPGGSDAAKHLVAYGESRQVTVKIEEFK